MVAPRCWVNTEFLRKCFTLLWTWRVSQSSSFISYIALWAPRRARSKFDPDKQPWHPGTVWPRRSTGHRAWALSCFTQQLCPKSGKSKTHQFARATNENISKHILLQAELPVQLNNRTLAGCHLFTSIPKLILSVQSLKAVLFFFWLVWILSFFCCQLDMSEFFPNNAPFETNFFELQEKRKKKNRALEISLHQWCLHKESEKIKIIPSPQKCMSEH